MSSLPDMWRIRRSTPSPPCRWMRNICCRIPGESCSLFFEKLGVYISEIKRYVNNTAHFHEEKQFVCGLWREKEIHGVSDRSMRIFACGQPCGNCVQLLRIRKRARIMVNKSEDAYKKKSAGNADRKMHETLRALRRFAAAGRRTGIAYPDCAFFHNVPSDRLTMILVCGIVFVKKWQPPLCVLRGSTLFLPGG